MDDLYSMLGAMGRAIGIDKCAEMNTPAGYLAIFVVVVAGILLAANIAIVFASLTKQKRIVERIIKVASYVVWIFRIGGGDGYKVDHHRAHGWH